MSRDDRVSEQGVAEVAVASIWLRQTVWAAIGLTTLLAAAGTVLTPALAVSHPLGMLWLEAADRNLVLAHRVDLIPYLIAGTTRRLVSDPLFYLAGRWHGPNSLARLERHLGGRSVHLFKRVFGRATYPTLVAFMGRTVSMLAGTFGIAPLPFAVIAVTRTAMGVLAFRWLGQLLGTQVDSILQVFQRDLSMLTAVLAAGVCSMALMARRRL